MCTYKAHKHAYTKLAIRSTLSIQDAKAVILAKDWNSSIHEARSHPSLSIVCATDFIAASWNNIWDEARDFGVRGTKLMQSLFGSLSLSLSLSRPVFGIMHV